MIDLAAAHGVEVAHRICGRLRLKVSQGPANPGLLEQIKGTFSALPGVEAIEVRPSSGSVVVTYDPEHEPQMAAFIARLPRPAPQVQAPRAAPARPPAGAARARPAREGAAAPRPRAANGAAANGRHHVPPKNKVAEELEQIEEEAEFLAEHSHAARAIVDAAKALDKKLKLATNNNLDLKIMVPIGLAAFTFIEIGAAAATPMWVTLAIFSLNHFVELHAHDDDEDEDEQESAEAGQARRAEYPEDGLTPGSGE